MTKSPKPTSTPKNLLKAELEIAQMQADRSAAKASSVESKLRSLKAQLEIIEVQKKLDAARGK